ncbi:putative phosphoglycerate mutase [Rhodobium orientis]|uniref:Histidine phosphatase family protein n=1 Tax=Rhodobium orientis TaxID=34017 RepID=A0A327JGW4_9HYPH|nr:histidine phosphatase family protein [Rhodobium orientis]MBB4303916.1 putative phosphoglycerate mutase [Rhodobium orientis]MBK5951461.1 histidine phosphatase family protein [Rhodobium orientis]RAI24534.1 histidine phosphatase family protein [Rhodobium orientis]
MAPPVLYFLRHGQTDWNVEGRLQGQTDIPLNDTGRAEARRNGLALKQHFEKEGIDPAGLDFIASPLGRARETMEIARAAMGLARDGYRIEQRVAEVKFGVWEGFTYKEIKARDADAFASRKADKWAFTPEDGESYATMSERVKAWYDALEAPTLCVAHGGTSRALRGFLLGLNSQEIPVQEAPQDRAFRWQDGELIWI